MFDFVNSSPRILRLEFKSIRSVILISGYKIIDKSVSNRFPEIIVYKFVTYSYQNFRSR